MNATLPDNTKRFANHLCQRFQREGFVYRECIRVINRDKNVFASKMMIHNKGNALVIDTIKSYLKTLDKIKPRL